ncbi:hypothetical protein M3J09_011062 [Ascochyta lentis]
MSIGHSSMSIYLDIETFRSELDNATEDMKMTLFSESELIAPHQSFRLEVLGQWGQGTRALLSVGFMK